MGCFSFLCKKCGKGIQGDTECYLFLLKEGQAIQRMEGKYSGYGTIYTGESSIEWKDGVCIENSICWNDPTPDIPLDVYWEKEGIDNPNNHGYWQRVSDLMFAEDTTNGIAAYHSECYEQEVPKSRSKDDPNQGCEQCPK